MALRFAVVVAFVAVAGAGALKQPTGMMQLKQKVQEQGVVCEDMCKKVLEYPKCQCPGFGSMPADEDDTRSCEAKYCHPPADRCPNDAFFTCVQETTAVSLVQSGASAEMAALQKKSDALEAAIAAYK